MTKPFILKPRKNATKCAVARVPNSAGKCVPRNKRCSADNNLQIGFAMRHAGARTERRRNKINIIVLGLSPDLKHRKTLTSWDEDHKIFIALWAAVLPGRTHGRKPSCWKQSRLGAEATTSAPFARGQVETRARVLSLPSAPVRQTSP